MPDFIQNGVITTLHDLGNIERDRLETLLERATTSYPIGLVLPVTASDMRAEPFARIVRELEATPYIDQIVVALDLAPDYDTFCEAKSRVAALGVQAAVLWLDGPRIRSLLETLVDAGLEVAVRGKGHAVWAAFGYLLGDPRLKAFVLHDCDIINYDRGVLARLCLPLAHPGLDFEFCKAYYARFTSRLHGRVTRLLLSPLLRALTTVLGPDRFLAYLDSFRYPLSGEFALSSALARSNRVPGTWGLEVGTLAEVFRNTAVKRVCQVDLCRRYEHKHQALCVERPGEGLMRMATEILLTLFHTLAGRGTVFQPGSFVTIRTAYLRAAQDAIRQYNADALINGLKFDRHEEEQAVEGFARQIVRAGAAFHELPANGSAIPNWSRVLSVFPDFPQRLRGAVAADAAELEKHRRQALPVASSA